MNYKCLNKQTYNYKNFTVTPLREEDIYKIKDWRNEQMDALRQNNVLTDTEQYNYYSNVVKKSFLEEKPRIILFSLLENSNCIGYGGLTNIDWYSERVEISFLVETSRTKDNAVYEVSFLSFLELMKMVAFEELKFNRLFTETFDIRPLHISLLEKSGFLLEGRMREHVFIKDKFVDSLIHGFIKSQYEFKR